MLTDNDWEQIMTVIGLLALGFFLHSQYVICVAMPAEWFAGLLSELVLVACFWLRRRSD